MPPQRYCRPAEDQQHLERLSEASRHALGDGRFTQAQREGQALEVEAAMHEVRNWLASSH
jgi:hypothetical protein